ncbi:tRNA (uracil-5-)-methyltransferase homolog A-like isoform X2 [Sycon ciliatum]|uniref:tRNA (uracil-5-)-methyltransferase homolog A-like isoform X2 n=1 Tax=Sycon ciliatum TaxID=27933 RepID=UPI0031F65482
MLSICRRRGIQLANNWTALTVSRNCHCRRLTSAPLTTSGALIRSEYQSHLSVRRFLCSSMEQGHAQTTNVETSQDSAAPAQQVEAAATATETVANVREETEEVAEEDDLVGYTKRGEFTSQNYRVSIKNLRKFPGYRVLAEWVKEKSGVGPHRLYVAGHTRTRQIYVTFKSEEDQATAIEKLNGSFYQGEKIQCVKEKPQADPYLERKGKSSRDGDKKNAKRARHADPEFEHLTPEERVARVIEPYKPLPYEEQLKRKQDWVSIVLKSITTQMSRNTLVPPWLPKQKAANAGMICELQDILHSPVKEAYRIKNEFSIGPGPEASPQVTVGFRLGAYKEGSMTIVSPEKCTIVPAIARDVATTFQGYVRQAEMLYFDECTHLGYWQTLTVRTPLAGGCMAVVGMHPQKLTQAEVETEVELLRKYFVDGPGKDSGITSMYIHFDITRYRKTTSLRDYYHVFGDMHLHEKLLGLTYRISADAFFQVNTLATERLYTLICDWCDVNEDSIVLGITNAEFICGKAEFVMDGLMKRYGRNPNLVAVVDPPRAGLHPDVCQLIRKTSALKRLVFVACNLKQSKDNILYLCKHPSRAITTMGFRPLKAVTVDMFPHTPHCEVAMLLERVPSPRLADFKTVGEPTTADTTADATQQPNQAEAQAE